MACHLQNTERKYEQTFANARKPASTAGAGGAGVDTQGLRKDAHGNIIQVLLLLFFRYMADPCSVPWLNMSFV